MIKELARCIGLLAASFTLASCSHASHATEIPTVSQQGSHARVAGGVQFQSGVKDVFAAARGLALIDSQLDQYITAPLSSADRALAHKIMRFMPPNLRGDFVYVDTLNGNRIFSNNVDLANSAVVTTSVMSTAAIHVTGKSRISSGQRRSAKDYVPPCSGAPGNPPAGGANGPYARYMSKCGFNAGWGFVYITPNTSSMACCNVNGGQFDDGYLYFETAGERGSLLEGGLAYYNDSSIAGYALVYNYSTQSTTQISLNNQTYRYSANQILGVFSGLTDNPQAGYSVYGQLCGSQNPETDWVNEDTVCLNNPVWNWYSVPSDFSDPGTDLAGWPTPCVNCTVTKLTTIGEGGCPTYCQDGSFFGVAPFNVSPGGKNAINWIQVAFGNWASQCVSGVTVCYFDTSSDPTVYGGGPQWYPDPYVSGQSLGPTGYGPYESWDGIDASGLYTVQGAERQANGSLSEPLPPPPCTPDAYGYCGVNTYGHGTAYCEMLHIVNGRPVYYQQPYTTTEVYAIFNSSGQQLEVATETISKGNTLCSPVTTSWYPGNPSAQYGDSGLP